MNHQTKAKGNLPLYIYHKQLHLGQDRAVKDTTQVLFQALHRDTQAHDASTRGLFLLESGPDPSVTGGKSGPYSYMGRRPFLEVQSKEKQVDLVDLSDLRDPRAVPQSTRPVQAPGSAYTLEGKPLSLLQDILSAYAPLVQPLERLTDNLAGQEDMDLGDPIPPVALPPLPFTGGALGHMGYDLVRTLEDLPQSPQDDLQVPDLHVFFPEELFVVDETTGDIHGFICLPGQTTKDLVHHLAGPPSGTSASERALSEKECRQKAHRKMAVLEGLLAESQGQGEDLSPGSSESTGSAGSAGSARSYKPYRLTKEKESPFVQATETKETFMAKVDQAKSFIEKGDIFQVVLSQRLDVQTTLQPLDALANLRAINPSPYMYYLDFGAYQVVGASPELLVKTTDHRVETCPIAGTRPRGSKPDQDQALELDLLQDPKERAEHMMLVDLARNDLGKVSTFGTVEIGDFMRVHRFAHVMHIVSTVHGQKRPDLHGLDTLAACLPAGTVSGAPKVRAMEIIDQLESRRRGIYGGAIGFVGFNGQSDTCLAIRTMVFKDGQAFVQAGAGIVAESDPEKEYEETLNKAQSLLTALACGDTYAGTCASTSADNGRSHP